MLSQCRKDSHRVKRNGEEFLKAYTLNGWILMKSNPMNEL
jgi:hypothetical protein